MLIEVINFKKGEWETELTTPKIFIGYYISRIRLLVI